MWRLQQQHQLGTGEAEKRAEEGTGALTAEPKPTVMSVMTEPGARKIGSKKVCHP